MGRLPALGKEKYRWSGQIQDTIDYCGSIRINPGRKRTYVATGDSGQGITHGNVAGILISDLILTQKHSPEQITGTPPHQRDALQASLMGSENLPIASDYNSSTDFNALAWLFIFLVAGRRAKQAQALWC